MVDLIIGMKRLTKVLMDGGSSLNIMTETLTFEVVGFHGTYHTILGRPCYAKFMAIPNYNYLKLKMTRPCRVITISSSFQHAYECEVECYEHIAAKELATIRKEVAKEAPNPKRLTRSFEPVEGAKEVLIDPSGSKGKVVRIGTTLSCE
ncbi:uncharacterized protein [Miscanthus floridulus]|uniref:uncharacterized protein n=1 Tax=Miscanthus floridulus TaxID=154761 RepID=UPI0034596684